jgi:hypothetical protein
VAPAGEAEKRGSPSGEVRITGVNAGVEDAAIVARFTLGGRPIEPGRPMPRASPRWSATPFGPRTSRRAIRR